MGSPSIVGIRVSVLHLGSDRDAPLTKRPRGILIANESRTPKNYRRHSATKLFPTLTDCCVVIATINNERLILFRVCHGRVNHGVVAVIELSKQSVLGDFGPAG